MANKSGGGLGLAGILIILLVAWGIIEFIGAYWQILLALAAVGGLVYMVFRSDKQPAKIPEENFKYEVKQTEPQLPPMPYSEKPQEKPMLVTTFVDEQGRTCHTIEFADGYDTRGIGEPFETYYNLSEEIRTSKDINAKLAVCEEQYKILPEFVRATLKDFGKLPNTIPCRDMGVEWYLRLGQWAKARAAIEKCIQAGAYDDGGQYALDYFTRYKTTAELALNFIEKNAGFLQKNLYKALPDADKDCLKSFARSSLLIRKEKTGNTNKLFLNKDLSVAEQ